MTPKDPNDDPDAELLVGALAFEHQTGPSRGKSTWLTGPALDVSLSPNRLVRVTDAKPEDTSQKPGDDVIARLSRVGDSYEIEDVKGGSVWVNGTPADSQLLMHGDMIEFGEAGPLSRFCIYCGDQPHNITVGDIFSDSHTYLRVSRQPIPIRLYRVCKALIRRLSRETTGLFRFSVVISLLVLAVLIYQQNQLDTLIQQRLEKGFSRLDSFAAALARARKEALTPSDLTGLRQELGQRLVVNAERLAAL